MRSMLVPLCFLSLAGCVVATPAPAPSTTTYVTPAPTAAYVAPAPTTTYVTPPTTTVIHSP
jgi:hypothetical protein